MTTNGVASATDRLADRLNDPHTADSLNRLLDRLDTVAFAVESFEGFISRGEVIADSVAASVDEVKQVGHGDAGELLKKAPQYLKTGTQLADVASTMNVDELTRSRVLEKLTDPQTLATLNQLMERLPLAAFLLESLEGFIERGETIADSLADGVKELNLGNLNLDADQVKAFFEGAPQIEGSWRTTAGIGSDERRTSQSHRCGCHHGRFRNDGSRRGRRAGRPRQEERGDLSRSRLPAG